MSMRRFLAPHIQPRFFAHWLRMAVSRHQNNPTTAKGEKIPPAAMKRRENIGRRWRSRSMIAIADPVTLPGREPQMATRAKILRGLGACNNHFSRATSSMYLTRPVPTPHTKMITA